MTWYDLPADQAESVLRWLRKWIPHSALPFYDADDPNSDDGAVSIREVDLDVMSWVMFRIEGDALYATGRSPKRMVNMQVATDTEGSAPAVLYRAMRAAGVSTAFLRVGRIHDTKRAWMGTYRAPPLTRLRTMRLRAITDEAAVILWAWDLAPPHGDANGFDLAAITRAAGAAHDPFERLCMPWRHPYALEGLPVIGARNTDLMMRVDMPDMWWMLPKQHSECYSNVALVVDRAVTFRWLGNYQRGMICTGIQWRDKSPARPEGEPPRAKLRGNDKKWVNLQYENALLEKPFEARNTEDAITLSVDATLWETFAWYARKNNLSSYYVVSIGHRRTLLACHESSVTQSGVRLDRPWVAMAGTAGRNYRKHVQRY